MTCRLNLVYRLFTRSLARSVRPMWSRSVLFLMMWCAALHAQTSAAPSTAQTTAPPARPGATAPVIPPVNPKPAPTPASVAASLPPTLTPESAMQLALLQASAYQQAVIDEQTAAL